MFWLGFLFGDENRKLKELERSRKQRELEEEEKKVSIMVEDFEPFLTSMKKEGMTETSVVFSDCSRFSYNALPKVLSKLGSKIAYTRLEKEKGTFTLTLYKNRPEAISRLYLAWILRGVLLIMLAIVMAYPFYTISQICIDSFASLSQPSSIVLGLFKLILVFLWVITSNVFAGLIFKETKIAKEFQHTIRFDKVVADE